MKIIGNTSNFEACPEFTGKAVCVDVTPLRKLQSQYGERDAFKVVFEVDMEKEDGGRFCVWSRPFTPSINEKSNFRKFVRAWFGRDLMESEMAEFDLETLIGKPAQLVVVHEHKEGEVYANIAACTPDKSGAALKVSGKFTRKKDREGGEGRKAKGRVVAAGSRRCHPRRVSGRTECATSSNAFRPSRLAISARLMRSGSVSNIRPLIWLRRIRFSVTRYSFLSRSSSSAEPVI
jgi:hypothetical protein